MAQLQRWRFEPPHTRDAFEQSLEHATLTFVVCVTGPETVWLAADRRLSSSRGYRDDGQKIMLLDTTDGVAILAYAGLGATASGKEPSDWMSATLNGLNLPMEQSLGHLAERIKERLPRHLKGSPHVVVAPAFVNGEARLYTINAIPSKPQKEYLVKYERRIMRPNLPVAPRVCLAGSGAVTVHKRGVECMRDILRLIAAHDRRTIAALTVADKFAALNQAVAAEDKLVGSRCVVAWRYSPQGVHRGGGGQQFYSGTKRDEASPALPTLAQRFDIRAIIGAIGPYTVDLMKTSMESGLPLEIDAAKVNELLADIPEGPNDELP
jgi:hypothetical protein